MKDVEYLHQFFTYRALGTLVNRSHTWLYALAKGDRIAVKSEYMNARLSKLAEVHKKLKTLNCWELRAQYDLLLVHYSEKHLLQLLDKTAEWGAKFKAGDQKTYTFEVANKLAFLTKVSGLNGRI